MSSINKCEYIIKNGPNKDKKCIHNAKIGSKFCIEHEIKEYNKCSICYELMKEKDICVLECNHKFHLSCIFTLYKTHNEFCNKCPLCRKEYTSFQYQEYMEVDGELLPIPQIIQEDPEPMPELEPDSDAEHEDIPILERAMPIYEYRRNIRGLMEEQEVERAVAIVNILNNDL